MMSIMRKVVAAAFVICMVGGFVRMAMAADKGGTLYTAYNLWYEKPTKMSSVNYHTGGIIPVGSKVTNVKVGGKKIEFTFSGGEYAIDFVQKFHPSMSVTDFKNQMLTSEDPATRISALPKSDQDLIKSGMVQPGMSKEAVLLSWGPAPQHMTPSPSAPMWTYWRNRFVKTTVTFDADGKKVASVQ